MSEFFVMLTFWCVAMADNAGCDSAVTNVWFPTEEMCSERADVLGGLLQAQAKENGHEIYNYVSKCLPMERRVLGEVN